MTADEMWPVSRPPRADVADLETACGPRCMSVLALDASVDSSAPPPSPSTRVEAVQIHASRRLRPLYRVRSPWRLQAFMTTLPPDAHVAPGSMCSGPRHSLGPIVSPKDRNKLSINFLANEPSRADTTARSKRSASPLSHRARGVNRPSSTLGRSDDTQVVSEISGDQPRTYVLEIVQHPHRAAEFGASTLTRLPLAPPLIAQLTLRDSSGRTAIDESELPFLVAQLSLLSEDGAAAADYVTEGRAQNAPRERLLYGNLVSSPHMLRNLQGRRGVYFVYPDVGVRQRGRFQMKVTLIRLPRFDDPQAVVQGGSGNGTVLAEARSLPFDVYPLRDYVAPGKKPLPASSAAPITHVRASSPPCCAPGRAAQTPLTQYFLQQGARMYAFASAIPFHRGAPLSS
ncbi:velvet factor-domain-containing protein [Lenzites betulinus]|nr:velvet factor-domain-containing protein [Lenzites betulinus]